MALLEARGLVKQYGRRTVVNGVNLDVNGGEIVGLLGPNGAGKTTTFRMIVGMIAPKAGVVTFNGRDITHLPMYRRARLGLGYLAQDSSVFRRLTVEQNLHAILELMTTRRGQPCRLRRRERRERADKLLEQFGLSHLRKNLAITLSGGERRRLEIARCLVSEPMLIMLDEPFTGIDPKTVGDIQCIVRDLRAQGIGVLITDHHVAETLRITNRSYLIANGTMLVHGTPLEIVNDPRAREVYLGEQFSAAMIGGHVAPAAQSSARPAGSSPAAAPPTTPSAPSRSPLQNWQAVPALLQALESPDPGVRGRGHQLLCQLCQTHLPFEPDGDPLVRRHQVTAIRAFLEHRQAG
jgi:lipopolysaccharide export system ATP-binding protein